ncbi:MAG TPA: hypothetical protein PKC99_17945 [Anaerolineales bacterium]|jgi:hypothetical protein|nr:MAG: hypothetical protein DCC59_01140 [Chloroflexota bacterium]HMN00890.1 hypothetical protein [Anaerolineales bacterium]
MQRNFSYIFLAVIWVFGISACTREGIRRNPPDPATESAPAILTPTSIAQEMLPTSVLPPLTATLAVVSPQPPSAAATSAAEVESLLQDLEQLLESSTSDVNVP